MLEIHFLTDKYSWISLNHFPQNWRGYSNFAFDAYNPESTPLEVVCRINNRRHDREGHRYRDRFNRSLTLSPCLTVMYSMSGATFPLNVNQLKSIVTRSGWSFPGKKAKA